MSDELGKRFNDHADSDDTDSSSDIDNSKNTSGTQNTSGAGSKPGPDKDPDSTRNRTQVPLYLDEQRAADLNDLYDRLDAKSKLDGDGGIEKHRDFMAAVVDLALESEDELAERLDIES